MTAVTTICATEAISRSLAAICAAGANEAAPVAPVLDSPACCFPALGWPPCMGKVFLQWSMVNKPEQSRGRQLCKASESRYLEVPS
jgi:hypothetical protein